MTVNNLAVLRSAQGDDEKAAELYSRALAVFEAELGAEHPTVVICRENYEALAINHSSLPIRSTRNL